VRAISIQSYGDPSGMAVVSVPDPIPGPGQLLIQTEAIGVGGVDAVIRRGTLGSGFAAGLIPGSEIAGRVVGIGEGIDEAWIGRRAWAFTGVGGAYAERAVAKLNDVTALPAGLTAIDAVALGSAGPVAHFALAHARFAAGESILVRGAAGSIGITAVQLAAAGGAARIAVTTSSVDRGNRLTALGANIVLDRSGNAEPLDHSNFDVVLDVVGGQQLPEFFDRLSPNGRMVLIGVVGGYPPADFGMSLMKAFQRSLSFATFSLDTVPIVDRNRIRADQFEQAARRELQAVVHDVMPLDEAADAHRRMDAGEVFGRIVLTV
jgi:NADPH:quinone reductase